MINDIIINNDIDKDIIYEDTRIFLRSILFLATNFEIAKGRLNCVIVIMNIISGFIKE